MFNDLASLRQHFHKYPEAGFEEYKTQQRLKEEAIKAGVPEANIKVCAKTGLVIDIPGQAPVIAKEDGKIDVIALRADIDCLRMTEDNPNLPYLSTVPGRAHMCGHDGHMASMVGTLRALQAAAGKLPSNKKVRILFQPAEEKPGGAEPMIKEGCLEGVEEVYGYHNWPTMPVGHLCVVTGPIMAAECEIEITIKGRGGHASQPHLVIDPVVCQAAVIMTLQTIVSRKIASRENAVVSIAMVHGGEAKNVIPDTVELKGTIRALDMAVMEQVKARIHQIVESVCRANDCTGTVNLIPGYPVLVNHPAETEHVLRVAKNVLGPNNAGPNPGLPMMGAEDFAYFTQERPGCFFFLGGGEEGRSNAINHSSQFDFNDKILPYSVHVFVRLVEDRLGVSLCPDLDTQLPIRND